LQNEKCFSNGGGMNLRDRLPRLNQIVPVFAVACLLIYGWTTYRFLQKVPSWLFYLNNWEILLNYSQALTLNFVECLIVVGAIIGYSALLPRRIFLDLFIARGTLLTLLGVGYLIYLALAIGASKASQFPWAIFNWSPAILLIILLLSIGLPKVPVVQKVLEEFADRTTVFLYILLPLSGLGILAFAIDNLF